MATIKNVAQDAGVSVATVSRALNRTEQVSPGVRDRVLEAVERLGYRPNAVARSLRSRSTKTLGLVIPSVSNPFFTLMSRAVEGVARERGYSLMLGNTDEDPDKEAEYLDMLLEKQVDGIIVSPARATSLLLADMVRTGIPVVFLDRYVRGVQAPVVRADGRKAVGDLVAYLARLGHEKLAIISGPPETVTGIERTEAFLWEARELGIPVHEECVKIGDFRRESGLRAMRELLKLDDKPTAVFAANNLMALGALQTLKRNGVRVPEDISFASFDDVSWFELVEPPITTISQPVAELGAAAARMLPELVEGIEVESVVLEADLVVRKSCARVGGEA